MCHFQSTDTTRGFDASCLLYQPRSGGDDDDVGNSVVLWFVYSTLIRLLYCTVGLSDRQTESALLYSTLLLRDSRPTAFPFRRSSVWSTTWWQEHTAAVALVSLLLLPQQQQLRRRLRPRDCSSLLLLRVKESERLMAVDQPTNEWTSWPLDWQPEASDRYTIDGQWGERKLELTKKKKKRRKLLTQLIGRVPCVPCPKGAREQHKIVLLFLHILLFGSKLRHSSLISSGASAVDKDGI